MLPGGQQQPQPATVLLHSTEHVHPITSGPLTALYGLAHKTSRHCGRSSHCLEEGHWRRRRGRERLQDVLGRGAGFPEELGHGRTVGLAVHAHVLHVRRLLQEQLHHRAPLRPLRLHAHRPSVRCTFCGVQPLMRSPPPSMKATVQAVLNSSTNTHVSVCVCRHGHTKEWIHPFCHSQLSRLLSCMCEGYGPWPRP